MTDKRIQFFIRSVNMKKLVLLLLFFSAIACNLLHAQPVPPNREDTLPEFLLKNAGNNRIIIGWVNNFRDIRQISIQRSLDSLNFYKTILTVPDPMAVQNGYMDVKAANDHMFYRLYIMRDKGVYLFSAAKKAVPDTATHKTEPVTIKADTVIINGKPVIVKAQPIVIKIDNMMRTDSVATPNPDYNKPKVIPFAPSLYVFTNRDGNISVALPDEEKKKFSIKFFDESKTLLFELKDLKERNFKIDKTDFYHAGWFYFELYEEGRLLEKHKFYLEKDF
jgi:hypothetical protein